MLYQMALILSYCFYLILPNRFYGRFFSLQKSGANPSEELPALVFVEGAQRVLDEGDGLHVLN